MDCRITKLIKQIAGVLACLSPAMIVRNATAETLRIQFVGNSVTDTVAMADWQS